MTEKNHLVGVKLVLTGDFDSYERDAATRLLEALGADVTSAVSGKTTAVIAGKNAGATKLGQAEKRGLPILNEAQLLALVAGQRLDEVLAATGAQPTAGSAVSPAAVSSAAVSEPAAPRAALPYREPPPRDGEYIEYHPGTERVFISGSYQDGLRHGSWKKYYPSGQLQDDYFWERGVKHGPERDWYASGQQSCDGMNRGGKRFGTWTWWYENGAQFHQYVYDEQGLRQGPYAYTLADGTPATTGQWLDDQYHGLWTWCKQEGMEKIERGYYRGAHHGRESAWYPGGPVAIERGWHLNAKHGREEIFDAAGNPTYQGAWIYGQPAGEHVSWDAARTETRTSYSGGIPAALAADTKTRDKIVKKLLKAKDSYAKAGAIAESVGYAYRAAYLLHLWRTGQVDVAAEPELWELLSEVAGLMTGDEVVALLSKAKTDVPCGTILPYLPANLDRIVMNVYQRDPAPIDAAWKSLPAPMQNVVALVRARFGHDIGNALHKELPAIVTQHVERYGLSDILWPDADGVLTQQKLFSDNYGTRTPLFDKVLALFGTWEQWVAALREAALKEAAEVVARLSFRIFRDVVERAPPDELAVLIGGMSLDHDTQDLIHRALTEWRRDDAVTTGRIALAVSDTGLRKWPTVATAIAKYADEGKEPPQALVDALRLAAESPTYSSSWQTDALGHLDDQQKAQPAYRVAYVDAAVGAAVPRTKLVREAMQRLSPSQIRSVIERALAEPYEKTLAAQFLYLVDDPALWERFLDIAEEDEYGHDDSIVYGVGELGLRAMPLLTARLARTKKKTWTEGYGKAILVALARGIVDIGTLPAEFDRFVRFDIVSADQTWQMYATFVERILWKLPAARAEAILLSGLSSSSAAAFARAFALIACCPTKAVCNKAFTELLTRESKFKSEQQRDVAAGVASLPSPVDWVRWIRQSGGGGGMGEALQRAIGYQAYEALDKELAAAGAPQVTAIDHVEKVRLRAKEIGGQEERIYLLRPVAIPSASDAVKSTLNIIGGAAPGVDAARWPSCDDEPMTHLFTLDTSTMPELKDRVGANVRAISVFCLHPDNNEAYESGTDCTAVVFTTDAQLQETAAPPDEVTLAAESRFEAVAVDVNSAVWSEEGELHKEIYRCSGRVLGKPIWLQQEAYPDATFLMQFDEQFCPMNLGDCGVMYVFAETAFWQCH